MRTKFDAFLIGSFLVANIFAQERAATDLPGTPRALASPGNPANRAGFSQDALLAYDTILYLYNIKVLYIQSNKI
jgi:hypothetical protein